MKFLTLHDLYLEQLKDLHSAETQLITALPKMANAASTPKLKSAFTAHPKETKEQFTCVLVDSASGVALSAKPPGNESDASREREFILWQQLLMHTSSALVWGKLHRGS